MNKKLLSTLLILSFPLATYALQPQQGNPAVPEKPQRLERMAKELGLSDEQKAKVGLIFDEEKQKFKRR